MIRKVMTSKRVWIGIIFLFVLLFASVLYQPLLKDMLPGPQKLLYSDEGRLLAAAPFTPMEMFPFGSDRLGVPLLNKIIEGAKYTIGFAFIIGFFRVFLGAIIGVWMEMYTKRVKKFAKGFGQAFDYVPTIFLAYIFIIPMYISVNGENVTVSTQWILIIFQLLVGIGLGIPTISIFVANEVAQYRNSEHVLSSVLIGASKWYIIRTHIWLYLKDKLLVLFVQHIIQALILFIHLGILHLFIGGQRIVAMDELGTKEKEFVSLSNEWSGLIGGDYADIFTQSWIILSPLLAFAVTIYIMKLMTEGIQDVFNVRIVSPSKKRRDEKKKQPVKPIEPSEELFVVAEERKDISHM